MRFDSHIHTEYSLDGIERPGDILAYVKQHTQLDAVAFTDHNVMFHRAAAETLTRRYGILVIPGIEVGDIRSGKHIVALNLDESDEKALLRLRNPYEIIACIARQGGLSVAAHPLRRGYASFSEMGFDAVETVNGGCGKRSRRVENPRHLPEMGCSDAHMKCHSGRAWTEVYGIDPAPLGEQTTAAEIRRLTENVIENVRHGLCRAGGVPFLDARYLDYGLLVGKKYVGRSLRALGALVP